VIKNREKTELISFFKHRIFLTLHAKRFLQIPLQKLYVIAKRICRS